MSARFGFSCNTTDLLRESYGASFRNPWAVFGEGFSPTQTEQRQLQRTVVYPRRGGVTHRRHDAVSSGGAFPQPLRARSLPLQSRPSSSSRTLTPLLDRVFFCQIRGGSDDDQLPWDRVPLDALQVPRTRLSVVIRDSSSLALHNLPLKLDFPGPHDPEGGALDPGKSHWLWHFSRHEPPRIHTDLTDLPWRRPKTRSNRAIQVTNRSNP